MKRHYTETDISVLQVLSEPGWMANSEALYLSVGCYQINPFENRMILLACEPSDA